jgi:hypothetical protein
MRNQMTVGFAMSLSLLASHRSWAQTGTSPRPLVQSAGPRLM